MRPKVESVLAACVLVFLLAGAALAQAPPSDQLQVGPPVRRIEPPSKSATADELEQRGDELRTEKAYLDALDYLQAALAKNPSSDRICNKIGIVELQTLRLKQAKKSFERAIKLNPQNADAYNNLGVVYYELKKHKKAIKLYTKAIALNQNMASYFSNLGAAYFARKKFEEATLAYGKALELDPQIFERTSRAGVSAHLASPEDRAHYDYVIARLYAKLGQAERSLQYLRRAMEEGYKDIGEVYKDADFAGLRKDPRFTELMAAKPPAIPE
jgi:tetratricopeptide (TPR) repeat protein